MPPKAVQITLIFRRDTESVYLTVSESATIRQLKQQLVTVYNATAYKEPHYNQDSSDEEDNDGSSLNLEDLYIGLPFNREDPDDECNELNDATKIKELGLKDMSTLLFSQGEAKFHIDRFESDYDEE